MNIDLWPYSSKQFYSKVQKDAALDVITENYLISTQSKTYAVKLGRANKGSKCYQQNMKISFKLFLWKKSVENPMKLLNRTKDDCIVLL